jgi:hypothetical protein
MWRQKRSDSGLSRRIDHSFLQFLSVFTLNHGSPEPYYNMGEREGLESEITNDFGINWDLEEVVRPSKIVKYFTFFKETIDSMELQSADWETTCSPPHLPRPAWL